MYNSIYYNKLGTKFSKKFCNSFKNLKVIILFLISIFRIILLASFF
jgi:hypothetical protein